MQCLGHAIVLVLLCIKQTAASSGSYDATVCNQKTYTSRSGKLIYVPNAWNPDGLGFQCMSVRDSPPAFDATWKWPSAADTVHSYPHVKLTAPALPVTLSNISAMHLTGKWSMGGGSTPAPRLSVDAKALADLDVTANVAFDMFADRNAEKSVKETMAETEIMIWLGRFGHAQPLGWNENRPRISLTLGNVEFTLYYGKNQRGTNVFSWVAAENALSFSAEVSPLLQYLWREGLVSAGSFVGVVAFGSEAFRSVDDVTFSASDFDMALDTGAAPTLPPEELPKSKSGSARTAPDTRGSRTWLVLSMSIIGSVGAVLS
ncbi:concanavalin A-like lectin/glucanase domain-containing protein [Triangularia verruculosa]|uniref:Concanavalin A-like lectin/glucanase domain-containing protein n=1 Tax=Triangularia verruculosa TaxID=2587418 RepID=A0AAN6XKB1_9PEZI|nr:concanavalin A-like lectin/glucanase domain-containing protein [Triangularia verruculosa]